MRLRSPLARRGVLLSSAGALSLACGTSGAPTPPMSVAAGGADASIPSEDAASSPTSADEGGAAQDAARIDAGDAGVAADASIDQASADSGADAGPPGPSGPAPLYPAAVGRQWTFHEVIDNPTSGTSDCTAVMMITGTSVRDGRDVFQTTTQTTCTPSWSSSFASELSINGDVVESWVDSMTPPQWGRIVDEPVQVGHSWNAYAQPPPNGQGTYTWVSHGSVTVAAGTFDDCWTLSWGTETVPTIGDNTYCRGVGYVKGTADYACSGCEKTTTELVSKNF